MSLLDQTSFVVAQKTKLIELTNEYAVRSESGEQIGGVVEVGQSWLKKIVRLLGEYDQYFTHRLSVREADGTEVLQVVRPAKIFKSRVIVSNAAGQEIGQLVQENVFGKIRFGLYAAGTQIGSLNAENWRAWDFHIQDAAGVQVARVTKTWEGFARTIFTTADNYIVQLEASLTDPMRSLVVAAALTIDTALKQDSRGFN